MQLEVRSELNVTVVGVREGVDDTREEQAASNRHGNAYAQTDTGKMTRTQRRHKLPRSRQIYHSQSNPSRVHKPPPPSQSRNHPLYLKIQRRRQRLCVMNTIGFHSNIEKVQLRFLGPFTVKLSKGREWINVALVSGLLYSLTLVTRYQMN